MCSTCLGPQPTQGHEVLGLGMTEGLCTGEGNAKTEGQLPESAWEARGVEDLLPGTLQQASCLL